MSRDLELEQIAIVDLAKKALAGDVSAERELALTIARLAAMKAPTQGWPTPGSVLFALLDVLATATKQPNGTLSRLAGALLDGVCAHPELMGLPYQFRPAQQLGPDGLVLMARTLGLAIAKVPRAAIVALNYGNPGGVKGFTVAVRALEKLLEYPVHEETARVLCTLEWNDDRLWILFRILAGGYGGGAFLGKDAVGEAARAVLPKLIDATAPITGDGATKLRALLLRENVLSEAQAQGAKPAHLPNRLPLDVAGALSLLAAWNLSSEDVLAGPPSRDTELAELEKQLGRTLPDELTRLLLVHGSIGDRDIVPPSQMKELGDDLISMIENHVEDDDTAPTGKGEYDVRTFDPAKRIALGTDPSGDLFFLATDAMSGAGEAPVIRFHHGECLVATLQNDSLGEYVATVFARVYARREGLTPSLDRLERRERQPLAGLEMTTAESKE